MQSKHPDRAEYSLYALAAIAFIFSTLITAIPPLSFCASYVYVITAFAVYYRERLDILNTLQIAILATILIVFIPLSIVVSPLKDVSLGGNSVFLWSIGTMVCVMIWLREKNENANDRQLLTLIVSIFFIASFISLAGMERLDKFPYIGNVFSNIPTIQTAFGASDKSLPANELGGMLSWLVPLAAGLLFARKHTKQKNSFFILLYLASGFVFLTFLLSQSRGAYFAGIIGIIITLVSLGKRGRLPLGIVFLSLAALVLLSGIENTIDVFSYDRRFDTFLPLLSGRSDIWERACFLIQDLPTWGIGMGTFGAIVPQLYPFRYVARTEVLEDAHNLPLQTVLDFGIPGAILLFLFFGSILLLLIKLRKSKNEAPFDRSIISGLLGSITAYILFNITDSVSLNSPVSGIAFVLVGMICSMASGISQKSRSAKTFVVAGGIVVGSIALTIIISPIREQVHVTKVLATGSVLQNGTTELTPIDKTHISSRSILWYAGIQALRQGDTLSARFYWGRLAKGHPEYIPFMENTMHNNLPFARLITNVQPNNPDALFWFARSAKKSMPDSAASAFQKGLKLQPNDGLAWLQLADVLLEMGEVQSAHEAYVRACFLDDPGLNACYRAGKTAEALGDTATAITMYRTSAFDRARKRANELQQSKK